MATGVVIKDSQGNTKQVPFDQLQQIDPFLYSQYVKNYAQPNADLQQTQTATGAEGASAARTMAEIPGAVANTQVQQSGANQLKALQAAGNAFDANKGKDGYVSPMDYNKYKAAYVGLGGDAAKFDNTYADNYVNPKNVFYDTPDAKTARGVLPVIKNVIDSYHNLSSQSGGNSRTGPEWGALANIPGIGGYLQQRALAPEKAHNDFLMGEAGNIRQIAGAGPQQGFRFNLQELNNITGLLPNAFDSKDVANSKLDELNSFMQTNMGVGLKDLYNK